MLYFTGPLRAAERRRPRTPTSKQRLIFFASRREYGRFGLRGGGRCGVGDLGEPGPGLPEKEPRSAGEPGGVDLFYNLCLTLHF